MGVFVVVENIDHGVFADRESDAVLVHHARERALARVDVLGLAAKAYGLAQVIALEAQIGRGAAYLVGLGAGEAREAVGVGKAEALIHLGRDIGLAALPQLDAKEARRRDRRTHLPVRRKAVLAGVRGGEFRIALWQHGELAMRTDRFGLGRRLRLRRVGFGLFPRRVRRAGLVPEMVV